MFMESSGASAASSRVGVASCVSRHGSAIKIDKSGGHKCEQVDSGRRNVVGKQHMVAVHPSGRIIITAAESAQIFLFSCSSPPSMFKHVRIDPIKRAKTNVDPKADFSTQLSIVGHSPYRAGDETTDEGNVYLFSVHEDD